jgi:DNA-binding NarL/FixJ family response regulator
MQDEPAYARKAFELGAQGYVVKDAADDELVGAIDAVLSDRIYVHPTLAARLVLGEPQDDLTDREREVLAIMAEGRSNQAICQRLYLSPKTVESYVRAVFTKLGLEMGADDNRRVLAVLAFLRS